MSGKFLSCAVVVVFFSCSQLVYAKRAPSAPVENPPSQLCQIGGILHDLTLDSAHPAKIRFIVGDKNGQSNKLEPLLNQMINPATDKLQLKTQKKSPLKDFALIQLSCSGASNYSFSCSLADHDGILGCSA